MWQSQVESNLTPLHNWLLCSKHYSEERLLRLLDAAHDAYLCTHATIFTLKQS